MNNALITMLDVNNQVFNNIADSARQVTRGSQQIADSSQSLAQGSTQQAESIDRLSASISDIAQKTRANADRAGQAAKLADSIQAIAEKGNSQMDSMMQAVREISEASRSISKVIETIDDIAFQTNILALNAAVESARAGAHGKGFAVVAEEVRNLAMKSAEAAKDTESLIAASMTKAETGVSMASATAASLSDIVAGIKRNSELVVQIAQSSEEQSLEITQINTGIDQVAAVVQQNSATAEENAAASEEMSSLSNVLQGMIAKFKLKEDEYSDMTASQPREAQRRGATGFSMANGAKY
jgi:methyl-accepting chemotaxis protein